MYDHNYASAGNGLFSYISMLFSFMSGVALPCVGFVLRIEAGNPPFFSRINMASGYHRKTHNLFIGHVTQPAQRQAGYGMNF